MIAYIKGKVIDEFEGGVVLENNGIGYEIQSSAGLLQKLLTDREGGVYTYLQVKEDGLSLFGFDNKEEKHMFLKLISISGIGPKMAMSILSGMRVSELATAIATSDVKGGSFSSFGKAFPKKPRKLPRTKFRPSSRHFLPRTRTRLSRSWA